MTWQHLLDAAGITVEDLKERLPLEWVVAEAGVLMEPANDGRLVGTCPFHPDEHPSFAIFGEDLDRVGCWSCDFGNGDLLDFIQRWKACTFKEALEEAVRLLRRFEETRDAWTPAARTPQEPVPIETLRHHARAAYATAEYDPTAIRALIQAKELPMPWSWLHEEFMLGVLGPDTVLIPHLIKEPGGLKLTGYKTRHGVNHPYAARGSKLTELYGGWRDTGHELVILCEGESDTWRVAWEYRNEADVFGLPSGVNALPKDPWLRRLQDRHVIILFDGDMPGRSAARNWHKALLAGEHPAASVKVVGLEDGADACTTADLRDAVNTAAPVPLWTGHVSTSPDGTHYLRTNNGQPICNWRLRPERLITLDEGGHAIEGHLPDGRKVVLTSDDLSSESATRHWSNRYGYSWLGSVRDAQSLLEFLLHDGPFLARGHGTRVLGWHAGHVVLPDRTIGPLHWVYVPPVTDPALDQVIRVAPSEWDPRTVALLRALHDPSVTTPILGWMAAAPLRSWCQVFPPLAVVGGSGAGKTTLLLEIMSAFGYANREFNLTSTTPHGVMVTVSATNGIPIWFDEYRPGARRDTLEAFNQALRDAWTASTATRGGIHRNLQALARFTTSAPIVVSGEDTFHETSHVERMVVVRVPQAGRNPDALSMLRKREDRGLGFEYLSWLVDNHWAGALPRPAIPNSSRPAQAQAVVAWG